MRPKAARIISFIVLMLLCAFCFADASDGGEELGPLGVAQARSLTLTVSTMPEAKLGFTWRFAFPALQGAGPLTRDNNVSLALTAEVSPISVNGLAEAVWTPVAFFQLAAGGRLGSGWVLDMGGEMYGIGKSFDAGGGALGYEGSAFDGLLWKLQGGAALQFDAAAVWPGTADWHHIVFRTYHEINYKANTAAAAGESWYFEHDHGENINGWNWYGNFLLGYQMPIFLNTVALLAEADLYLYDTPGRGRWGDDLVRWTFSAVANFDIVKNLSAALIVQTRTRRNGVDPVYTARRTRYYRALSLDSGSRQRLEFYRVAVALTYAF
jgi:hypothetical protein